MSVGQILGGVICSIALHKKKRVYSPPQKAMGSRPWLDARTSPPQCAVANEGGLLRRSFAQEARYHDRKVMELHKITLSYSQ
jgi:hypothetical protein